MCDAVGGGGEGPLVVGMWLGVADVVFQLAVRHCRLGTLNDWLACCSGVARARARACPLALLKLRVANAYGGRVDPNISRYNPIGKNSVHLVCTEDCGTC